MPKILVVDDSAVDRQFVGGLLKKDAAFEIQFAVHGAQALEKIAQQLPDLVLTDLIMPEMDGLDLVTTVHDKYPLVPVILMTFQGNEEIAVAALQQGAASYVPKRNLAWDLMSTVQRVLAVSSRRRSHTRLLGCMTDSTGTFVLENDAALFNPLVAYLQEGLRHMDLCDANDYTRVGVALEEALANALYHGNLGIGSELRGEEEQAYYALVEQHLREAPYRDRRIHVRARLSRREAQFVIRDEGAGFDFSALPDPTDPANLEKPCGRGILLMRAFMDEVAYNDVGNTVTLTKRSARATQPDGSDAS